MKRADTAKARAGAHFSSDAGGHVPYDQPRDHQDRHDRMELHRCFWWRGDVGPGSLHRDRWSCLEHRSWVDHETKGLGGSIETMRLILRFFSLKKGISVRI
jgi:hypothetical protein